MTTVRTFGIGGTTDPAEDYRLIDSGLLVPVSALNARSGVTSTPTLTSTGSFTCNISAFTAAIDGTSNATQGVYRIAVDGPSLITVSAASAQARIDLIYAQILDNAYDGSGLTKGQVQYLAGIPGSGTAPATPANAIALFNVPVAASASSADFAHATAQYPYTAAIGGIVPVHSAGDKPAAAAGVQYRHRLDVTAAPGGVTPLESSTDGTTWTPVWDPAGAYGTWTNTTTSGAFTVNQQPQYRTAPGNRIELRGSVIANTTVGPTAGVIGSLPAPAADRYMPLAATAGGIYLWLQHGTTTADMIAPGPGAQPSGTVLGFDGLSYSL